MANDSSLGAAETQAFDLETQKGVMHLLASVRASELDGERKNELRDLVFEYTNGGRDETVHRSLMQKVTDYGVTPVVVEQPEPEPVVVEQPQYDFGTSRPAPAFSAPTASPKAAESAPTPEPAKTEPTSEPEPIVKKEVVEEQSPEPESAEQAPADLPVEVETPATEEMKVLEVNKPALQPEPEPATPTPESPTPEPVPEPPKPEPAPMPEPPKQEPVPEPPTPEPPTPTPEPPKPEPVPEPLKPEPAAAPEPTPEPVKQDPANTASAGGSTEQSLQRIREIKAIVNDRVGNPVNLVDIDNEVGREYMSALLDAMKKLNSGVAPASAMKRLEDAFASVERTLNEKGDAPAPDTSKPEPVPEPPKPAPAQPASGPQEEKREIAKPSVPPLEVVKPPQPVPVPPAPKPQGSSAMPNVPPSPQNEASKQVKVEPPKVVPKGAPAPESKELSPKEVATAWGPETDTVKAEQAAETKPTAPQSITPKAASLAQSETKLRTPTDLPLASSIETSSVAGDPLFTRQVDDGLEQLLSEWSLFKKSGLFGTGPKGREHPLYKKLSDLQIPLLLAGRFEGATQEIKQSITDYMNGWRYEQGIIYEQGETFEHYLRRVIRHILDLQQGTKKG